MTYAPHMTRACRQHPNLTILSPRPRPERAPIDAKAAPCDPSPDFVPPSCSPRSSSPSPRAVVVATRSAAHLHPRRRYYAGGHEGRDNSDGGRHIEVRARYLRKLPLRSRDRARTQRHSGGLTGNIEGDYVSPGNHSATQQFDVAGLSRMHRRCHHRQRRLDEGRYRLEEDHVDRS